MRTIYLVCYDVADDKRLRRAFKICRNFGDHLQYSVFECDLNPSEKIELEETLRNIINHDEDQVLFVALGPAERRGRPGHHGAWLALYETGRSMLCGLKFGCLTN